MRQVVQLHASVEEIGMRSARWTTISHGVRYTQLPDGTMGLEVAPKCVHACARFRWHGVPCSISARGGSCLLLVEGTSARSAPSSSPC